MHNYLRLLRDRSAALVCLANLLAATGIGAYDLSVILHIRNATGSLTWAGIVGGALTIGNALGLTWQGQLLDRLGGRLLIPVTGLGCTAAGWALTTVPGDLPWILMLLAALGGLLLPAVTTAARPTVDEVQRNTGSVAGYALLSLTFQLGLTVGPLLVSGVMIMADSRWAVRVSGLLLTAAGLLMIMVRTRPASPVPGRHRWSAAFVRLLAIAALSGFAGGLSRIGATGYAARVGRVADVGLLLSAAAVGGIVGGLVYGARTWPGRRDDQLRISLAVAAGIGVLMVPLTGLGAQLPAQVFIIVAVLFGASGLSSAPGGILTSVLVDSAVPYAARARGYAAMVSCSLVSSALGSSIGGSLSDALGPAAPFVCGAAAVTAAAMCVSRSGDAGPSG